ncbi:MAG: hypothetical protein DWQ45_12920 [Planctomycetota bacterium]|nr:MAG: hypothetical protein DWQ41_25790 [Planctomycetota bacterium]REK34717.1 MAG: hypothetical protein DWQ45_12920 [Planctomycetota bacterium]
MSALVVLAFPIVILLLLRALLHRMCPWLMRPVEKILRSALKTVWNIVWKAPAHRWGGVNVAWMWLVIGAAAVTTEILSSRGPDLGALACLWIIIGGIWWLLRVWNRWRLSPYRLPQRRRRRG